jgi:predicted ribosomally synthesized peptide with nif11-like leader
MSEEQLQALFAKLKDDAGLLQKLKGAADLDAAVAIAKQAGFDVNKSDWLNYQASKAELTDEELKDVAGGAAYNIIDLSNTQCNIIESSLFNMPIDDIKIFDKQSNIIDISNIC